MSLSTEPECFPGYFALLTYSTERENWSYYEFLTTYRNVIISSPPFSEEWNGLDGAWTHRFLRKAKEFKPDDHENLKNKLAVKRTHVLGSLSILDEAGKYNVGDLISEGLSNSFHVDYDKKRKQKRYKEQKKKSFSRTRGDILPNGTKIMKPSPLNYVHSDEGDETDYETTWNDNDEDEEALPSEDSLTFAFNSSKTWTLPSGQNVGNIYAKKISENA
ncbi:hypothetical protein F8M41_007838 [Gigaspora margarita]|uniref:Uncharacterized protein n=1 Tax=Gigaspora margarita TaxID=4874 RepID=A0A8H3X4I5_GIGMA|nr:hypothetical protein F8M41_007838 [Gigaspora margarita]